MAKRPAKPRRNDMPKGLALALADPKNKTDSGQLLSDIIESWGGTRQLALDLYSEYQRAAAGGMTRQRILEMIQRLIITNTTQDIGQALKPSDLSDEDLDAIAMKYAAKVTGVSVGPAAAP